MQEQHRRAPRVPRLLPVHRVTAIEPQAARPVRIDRRKEVAAVRHLRQSKEPALIMSCELPQVDSQPARRRNHVGPAGAFGYRQPEITQQKVGSRIGDRRKYSESAANYHP